MFKYLCPVCGFEGLKEAPYDKDGFPSYEICPCCGFEFGADEDKGEDKYSEFLQKWIENGAQWFNPRLKPQDWNLDAQLKKIK